jgi:dTMP kinase
MKQLLSKLDKETVIIFDRYVQSNMIHQAGKIGPSNEQQVDEFLDWLENLEFGILKLPRPDKVIFLDVPVELSYKITTSREQMKIGEAWTFDIHERDKRHLVDSYLAGKYVAQKQGWEVINCIEDGALKSIDDIHELIKKVVKPMLNK